VSKLDFTRSIEACAAYYGEEAEAVKSYMFEGQAKAALLDNRGPIRFDDNGALHTDIIDAYSAHGFYIFEGVIGSQELADIKQDYAELRERFPTDPASKFDSEGRPALGLGGKAPGLTWCKPLSDPLGGTEFGNGRHQVKLKELEAASDAPEMAPFVLFGSLLCSEAALRTYAHPQLLRVAEAINGNDFAPFNEVLFIKDPGIGAAVSWHQDGDTHWNSTNFEENIHGFNFMAQVFGSTPVNGVWVVPGTHKLGKMDIRKMVEESHSERHA